MGSAPLYVTRGTGRRALAKSWRGPRRNLMSSHGGGGISDGKASSHLTPNQKHLEFRLSRLQRCE